MEHAAHNTQSHTGQECDEGIPAAGLFRLGKGLIVVQKIFQLAFAPENAGTALIEVFAAEQAVQQIGLPEGVHLAHFRGVALDARPDGHGHFQAERCAAGDALLLQAQHPVHAAGGKGQKQHGIQ